MPSKPTTTGATELPTTPYSDFPMKYNTLRRRFEYRPGSGFIYDRYESRKHKHDRALGMQIPFEMDIQKQFPHFGFIDRFIDLNRNLQRKRWRTTMWLPDFIHIIHFRMPPPGPVVYREEKRHEYEDIMRKTEMAWYDAHGTLEYPSLKALEPYVPPREREEHYKIFNLSWFKPPHPYIYWNWRNQTWHIKRTPAPGKVYSKTYQFDEYIYAVADLCRIAQAIGDPRLEEYRTLNIPLLPRSQSARARSLGLRRPETRIEALWRATDETIMRTGFEEYDPAEHYAVARMADELAKV